MTTYNEICAVQIVTTGLWKVFLGDEHYNTTALQHYNTTALKHCNTKPLQHYNTTPIQHNNTTALHHYKTTALQHYSTTALKHYNTKPLQHYNTTPIQHNNTTALQHYSTTALHLHRTFTNGLRQTTALPVSSSQWSHDTLFCSRSWYCFVAWTARLERLSELICTETLHCHCLLKLNTHQECHLGPSVFHTINLWNLVIDMDEIWCVSGTQ